jgi:hypothetical protein
MTEKTRQEILASAGIYEIELDEKGQRKLEAINDAYGKVFDEKHEARMNKYAVAIRKIRREGVIWI